MAILNQGFEAYAMVLQKASGISKMHRSRERNLHTSETQKKAALRLSDESSKVSESEAGKLKPSEKDIPEEWSQGDKLFIAFLIIMVIVALLIFFFLKAPNTHTPTYDGHDYGRLLSWAV